MFNQSVFVTTHDMSFEEETCRLKSILTRLN